MTDYNAKAKILNYLVTNNRNAYLKHHYKGTSKKKRIIGSVLFKGVSYQDQRLQGDHAQSPV